MPAIASTDLTITCTSRGVMGKQRYWLGTIAFGDGALTYPSGGVPLPSIDKFGMGKRVDHFAIQKDGVEDFTYGYDYTNNKIRIGAVYSHTHNLLFKGGITATEAVAIDGGDTLGKNAATDRTIAGSTSATKGGVVVNTINTAAVTEATTALTPAATTLRVMIFGR